MAYTTIDNPGEYFGTLLWTGDNTNNRDITGLDFTPDWTWIKLRSGAGNNGLFDSVRGASKSLRSNETRAEDTSPDNKDVDSFISGGIRIDQSSLIDTNTNGYTTVAWNWRAGTAFSNDASSTSIGTLDSAGSSNQEAGFSIVSYTSNGSSNQSVAHNLGGVPEMIISKNRDSTSASYNYWTVYHHSLATANDKKLKLNTTDVASTTNEWGDTDPTSTVYSLHTSGDGTTNHSTDKMISYCFRSIKGYSKFGSYTGNGNADGTFVYTGFKSAFVMVKKTSGAGSANWVIADTARSDVPNANVNDQVLYPNLSNSEESSSGLSVDAVSNGFKIRGTGGDRNTSGASYIYLAFASSPFVTGSSAIPTTAR